MVGTEPYLEAVMFDTGSLIYTSDFQGAKQMLAQGLLATTPINAGTWQQLDISNSSAHDTWELLNVTMVLKMPSDISEAQQMIQPDLPWAEDHFAERVGGKPINPGVAWEYWPYHRHGVDLHLREGKKYDHNYMERMWCKGLVFEDPLIGWDPFRGYRFPVGDLRDVVNQLKKNPSTRQAYLPIWFPEDTGAIENQRIPCSIGYHFIIRDNKLHLQYNLRSCEIYRHFTNDVYLAIRLAQWMDEQLLELELEMGNLTMHMVSFHGFVGDRKFIEEMSSK